MTAMQIVRQGARTRAYDIVVDIGRFMIFTWAHLRNLLRALDEGDVVVVVPGSLDQARDLRNSFTAAERERMIRACLTPEQNARVVFLPQRDVGNGKRWATQVQERVWSFAGEIGRPEAEIAVIGHRKDQTSAYLDDFGSFDLIHVENIGGISASDVRDEYFRIDAGELEAWLCRRADAIPEGTASFLRAFARTADYAYLREEARRRDDQDRKWSVAPHPVTFTTSIAMVVQGTKVLMIPRRQHPGKGYWMLPAAIISPDQRLMTAATAVLSDQAGLDVSRTVLEQAFLESWIEDDPNRSTSGRTIGHPHLFLLQPRPQGRTSSERHASLQPPRLRGGAEGTRPEWKDLAWIEANRDRIFEDNAIIIDKGFDRLARHVGR